MNHPHTLRLLTWARLVALSLLLLVGLLAGSLLASSRAHAQPAATLTVTDCSGQTGTGRIGTVISSASAGDTILFSCSGTIPISSTLPISTNLTLDGSGQSVTLDGGNSVGVLFVNPGVSFTLKALTVAHGSSGDGGGLFNDGTVTISNSTFANNSATAAGGGLFNDGSTVTISNSTFANNSATSGGGGLWNQGGPVTISNSTFANNSTTSGGGGLFNISDTLSISNSIVANNSGGNCHNFSGSPISDQGYNLESGTDCGFTGTGSLQNTDPKLASALASNGGPTQTLALLSGSPAIDHIPAAHCPATDQRGVSRPDNGETTCDMGAYEFVDSDNDLGLTNVPANITVDATSSQGATVTYTAPTVVDEESPLPPVTCSPASGSVFPIGTTPVTCTVSDSDDTPSSVSQTFTVTVKDVTPPTLSLPGTITVDATSPQGATVSYTVTATDPDNSSSQLTISCTPASGSTFPIGTTTVNCTATDPSGNSSNGTFLVVVKDVTPPVLSLPSPITVDATSPQGASVTYTVTATDPDNAASELTISCSPASGSTFAIGTTMVKCSASDPAGNKATGSFQVVVKGAAAQVNDLVSLVNSFHLSSSLQNALDVKLNAAFKAINAGQTATACSDLSDFIGQVYAQTGKGITTSQATQLIAAATNIKKVLAC